MKLHILVTGAAGYLGSVLVPKLLALGHSVTAIDSFMFGQNSLMDCCHNPDLTIVRGDARAEALLREHAKKADVIIPLAALVGAPLCARDEIGTISTNRDAIKTLVGVLGKEQRIVIPITNSGYGVGNKDEYCTEETPLNPISTYGKTKVEAEEIALQRENSVSLRLATVFGASPRMRIDLLVNDFTHRAVTDRFIVVFEGHFKRNYIHIRDVSKAFIHAIDNFDNMAGEPYNVGLSDANLSKLELCATIQKHIPEFVFLESEIGKDVDKRDYIVSNDKIEKTGFKPDFSLDDGIAELKKVYTVLTNSKYSNV